MAINKKLIHFKKYETFNGSQGINGATEPTDGMYGNIPEHSIVFILDVKKIWTHGQLYDGSTFDPSDIKANIQAVDTAESVEDVETNTYVKYVTLTLTDELKALVRENIGASSISDLVTVDLSNYYTKSEINTKIGDINTILESIINS